MSERSFSQLSERLLQFNENVTRLETRLELVTMERISAEEDATKTRYDAEIQQKSSEVIKSWLDDMLRSNVDAIAELATSGLRHIIDDQNLSFAIKQEMKYNRLSMRFVLEDDGVEGDPMSSFGGGAVLIASLILRLAVMTRMKMGNLLLLDETMFALANKYVPAAADFMRHLTEETGINILMVTHNEEFMSNAHLAYEGSLVPSQDNGPNKKKLQLRRRAVR